MSDIQNQDQAGGYYQRHIFFEGLNERPNGEDCCVLHGAKGRGFDHCKAQSQGRGLAGKAGAVNKAGCLDRCAGGSRGPWSAPKPSGIPSSTTQSDIDEIVDRAQSGQGGSSAPECCRKRGDAPSGCLSP